MDLIIAVLFLPIPLITGIIVYKYTKFRKKLYKYIPALIMFMINIWCWIKMYLEPTNDSGIAYILPTILSNLLGVIFYVIAIKSDYKINMNKKGGDKDEIYKYK